MSRIRRRSVPLAGDRAACQIEMQVPEERAGLPLTFPTVQTCQPGRKGRWRRVLAVLAGALTLIVLVPTGPAAAHTHLVSSSPAAGAVVTRSPAAIELQFSEPVRSVADGFRLYDHQGAVQALVGNVTDGTVRIELPADLPEGSFVVGWRVVSDDSHPVSGALTFAVGRVDDSSVAVTQSDSATVALTYGALQGLGYVAILVLVGLAVFETVVVRSLATDRRQRRRVVRVAVGTAVTTYLALVPLSLVREDGGHLSDLLSPSTLLAGWVSAPGAGFLVVLAGSTLVLVANGSNNRRLRDVAGMIGAGVVLASVLPVGHAQTYAPAWLVLTADVVHAGTAAVWLGGLIGLGLMLTKAHRAGSAPRETALVLSRFSTLAGGLVGVLAVTGLTLAVIIVGSVQGLVGSSYGRLLLVKLALVGFVVGVAAWNRLRLVPRLIGVGSDPQSWSRLTRAVVVEAVILVLIACVTGALGMQSPASTAPGTNSATTVGQPPVVATSLATDLGSGHFTGAMAPGRVGSNDIDFQLTGANDQPIVLVALPEVRVSSPQQGIPSLTAQVQPGDTPGSYRAVVTLPVPGTWQMAVAARVSEFDQPVAIVDVTISP